MKIYLNFYGQFFVKIDGKNNNNVNKTHFNQWQLFLHQWSAWWGVFLIHN